MVAAGTAFSALFWIALSIWLLLIAHPVFIGMRWLEVIVLALLLFGVVIATLPAHGQTVQEQQRQGYEKGLALMNGGDWVLACQAYNLSGGQKYRCTEMGWTKPFYPTEAECERTKSKLQSVVAAKAPSWHVIALCYRLGRK